MGFSARALMAASTPASQTCFVTHSLRSVYPLDRSDNSVREEGFRRLLDAAPDAMVVVDRRGSVAAVSRQAEQLFGWAEGELLGQPIDQLIPPRFQRVHVAQRASEDESLGIPLREAPVSLFARRRDGTEFPVEISQTRLSSGKHALVLVTIRDLTEWRRAQDSLFREKEQALVTLESIGDAVITTDAAGRITFLNPVAERLTGWRAVEALGQPLDTVLTRRSQSVVATVRANISYGFIQPSVCRGRPLSSRATASSCA